MASGPIFAEKTVLNSSNVIYPEWFLKFPGKLYYRRYPIIKLTRQRIGTQSNNPHPVSSTTFRILYNLPKIQAHAAKCQPRGKEQKIGHGQFLLDHPLARLRSQRSRNLCMGDENNPPNKCDYIEEDSLLAVDDLSINFESSSPAFKLIFWHSNCSAYGLEG